MTNPADQERRQRAIEHHVKALQALGWRFHGRGLYPAWTPAQPLTKTLPPLKSFNASENQDRTLSD